MNEEFKTLSNIMDNRYSCRAYLSKEVTNENINQIVSTASKVPTWCNAQPWSVLVTKGNQTKAFSKALVDAVKSGPMNPDFDWPKQYTGEYQARRRVCGYQLYESLGIAREDRKSRAEQMMQNFKFFGAPHVAIITTESDLGPYGAMDCGGFIALFALAARALGVASVVQASVTGYAPIIRSHFRIPKNRLIQTAITFGYENKDHPANGFRTQRAAIEDVVDIIT